MAGRGARCDVKLLNNYCVDAMDIHGSFHPSRLMESVKLLLEGAHSQKIQVLQAKAKRGLCHSWLQGLVIRFFPGL